MTLFAAIFNTDGASAGFEQIEAAKRHLSFQQPFDGRIVTLGESRQVALLVARDRPGSPDQSAPDIQSLDGRYSLAGRIRLDARAELVAALSSKSRRPLDDLPDALLCVHAYAAWGDGFLDRLAGDYSLVLWDDDRRQLICARDQLGVRPLFYAKRKNAWFVSDSLACIASQPGIDKQLDDYWIADFLVSGHSREFERTVYRHIKRLPPAHVLKISAEGGAARRYWRLDLKEPIFFRDRRLYGERFRELLSSSIRDRLPIGKLGISLSGGLDSTTLAACAADVVGDRTRLVAETRHFEHLIPDDEKRFSALAAERLGIALNFRAVDDFYYDPQWQMQEIRTSEPTEAILRARPERETAREMAADATVWLYGEGPDNALVFEREAYLSWLFSRREWAHLASATMQYLRVKRGRGWTTMIGRYIRKSESPSRGLPDWLNPDLVRDLRLDERARELEASIEPPHPWHPRAIASFNDPIWQSFLGAFDSEVSATPIEWRHPYLDLRVLTYMLSVPPVPWAREKLLLREAMSGRLPREILTRTKSPLSKSPLFEALKKHGLPTISANDRLSRYVDEKRLPGAMTGVMPAQAEAELRLNVDALNHWLKLNAP